MNLRAHGRTFARLRRSLVALLSAIALLAALAVPSFVVSSAAGAVTVTSASFNVAFARNGTALVLSVNTSNDVNCVEVTGDHTATQTSVAVQTLWTFNFTAGAGNGTKNVAVTAWKNKQCNGQSATGAASYLLDNTNPTISGTRTPAANVNGWNNTNVGVNFTCSDAGSGILSCNPSSTTLTTEGANQSASSTATDRAGNTASTSVTGISIDKTAPTLTGAPTTAPNGAGWYHGNVTIQWTCGDALSGIAAGTCPANSTISGEGIGLTASSSVSDRAGNTTTATSSPAVKIDQTAPVTSASALPVWNNSNVTVALSAFDALSGVAETDWSLDGGATHVGTSVPVSTDGDHTLSFFSIDNAGNTEATQTIHVRIDQTPPTIGHSQSPAANANGWNNSSVTVTFGCADSGSGIATCTTPQTVTTQGHDQLVTGTATDNAGNSATDPATVSIDETKPTITVARDRAANSGGWYKADVTVTYTCGDALSGVAGCSTPQVLGEGANQSATGTVTDAAGNSATVTDSPINVDETPPTITGAPTVSPNANGWYNGDVTIHWTCGDALSGIAGTCPADSVITGSGAALTASASVSDVAGNSTLATSAPVKIDRLAPVTTSDAPQTWQNHDVTVHFDAVDDLSGVQHTYVAVNGGSPQPATTATVSAEGETDLQFWSIDFAGNIEAAHSVSVLIDKTNPSIEGTRTPAANANGWNNTDVGVNFTCADEVGGSGIADCSGSTTLTSEGAGQSVTGTATDAAGNSANATVSDINIDTTDPLLAGAPASSPNANGWYNGDVVIHWTCGDARSGIDGSCPADHTISGEGTGLTASTSVSDRAGNTVNATSNPAVNIDRTPPVTVASAPPAWNSIDVTVNLSASDALSGVAETHWSLDGGATQTGTSVPVTTEGDHTLAFSSVDNAGNVEASQTIHVKIDKTAPTIGHTQSPLANVNGWNNANVTVTFMCGDALSGIASCTAPQTVTTEGHNQSVVGTATDNAGNTANDPASVSIDKTAPTVTSQRDRAANGNGWYNAPVTVTYTCGDALSGVDSCSAPDTFAEGGNQTATGSVTDAAGNGANVSDSPINVDVTPPTITGAPTTSPNANGWYQGDVTIHWTCDDTLSGVAACPPDTVITDSGIGLTLTGAVSDLAGNTAVGTSSPVDIDRVAPTTTSDAPTGWQTTDVTVHFTATDGLSGVDHTYFSLNHGPTQTGSSTVVATEGTNLLEFWSVDAAGNVENAESATVLLDKSAPTIAHTQNPAPNAQGWNNTNVDVAFSCADAISGVASCSPGSTLTGDGAHQLVTGTAIDVAGNSATNVADVSIDKTKPTITGAPDRAPNANDWYNADVTVTFGCADALSGVATCSGPSTVGEGAGQSVVGNATDNADNPATTTVGDLNVDETAPTISGAPTTSPNGAGWYSAPVDIEWTCADALSGIDGACPPNSTIVGEGQNLGATQNTADKAGNTASAAVNGIHIDQTPPSTDASSPSDWVDHAVTVDLSATDNLSGVAETHYILDGGTDQTGTSISIDTEGVHTLEYWSVDVAGNEEVHHHISVLVDLTAPTISHTQSPDANGAGWNNTDVVVTFTCDDQPGLSGVASCTSPKTVSGEGLSQPVVGTAVDHAGNSATDTASVSVDKTAPTISGAPDRAPNGNGWYNADVSVSFICGDALSGIASCTTPVNLGEGAAQSVVGTAVDAAGNSRTATVTGIDVDETAPTITGAPTTVANANGWYRGDVTVHWSCADALSGLAAPCPGDTVLTGEGDNLSATASIDDRAGNHSSATVAGIKIDRVAPTTTSDAPTAWQNADVTVGLTAHDGLSGVDTTRYAIDGGAAHDGTTVAIIGQGMHTLEFWSIDLAGNEETHHVQTVRIDKTLPTIIHTQAPPPNAHGWNNSPVEVDFHCGDALSGVASCSDPTTLSGDGASQTVVGTAVDNATNTESDTATVNIDQAKPTITAARDRTANANNWYNADVTVSFTCADALSGIASCAAPHTLGEGAGQSATGTAVDLAGNSDNVTESGINVDTTAPTITGAPTTAPNASGWYSGDVTVHWTCSDALSGLDGACPTDSVITSEGDNLSASASISDLAGNTSTATVANIKIDRTAPSTSASAPSAWVNNDVTVSLSATDALSGVAATYSSLDGASAHAGTSVAITTEGVHTLEYWSVDHADNEEAHSTVTVRIDKTAPTITHTQAPVPNANGWNNTAVTVSFDCADQSTLSGLASCTAPQTVSTQGQAQVVNGVAHDNAGNSAYDAATLNVDTTPPTITGAPDRASNAAGWYRNDVTVTFTCGDALSGIDSCTSPQTRGEGAAQSVAGTAVDAAGNSAHTSVDNLNIDKTRPTISGAPTTAPNANGWYSGDVTIHWTCGDALSGIDGVCPADSVITGEGAALSASASVADMAGNQASATVDHIKIDRTAPVTSSNAPVGWRNSDVTVTFSALDNLSGVGATYYQVDGGAVGHGSSVTISTEGTHNVAFWSVDAAGNEETHRNAIVQLDKTAPTITGAPTTAANAAGWYRTPVTVHFTCADQALLSGIASCSGDQTVATSGANQSVTGTALDNAGNTSSYTVSGLNVDLVPPTDAISGVADGATYQLGAVPSPACSAVDTLSGPAGCTGVVAGGSPNGVGTYTYTATGNDVAGNVTTRAVTYHVVYVFGGFLQPVNDTAHQVGVNTSIFKAGSTVPVKFQISKANGAGVTPNAAPQWLTPVKGSSLAAAVDESAYSAVATSGSTYQLNGQQYMYNWSTKDLPAGFYYRIGVRLDDGTTYTVNVGLR